MEPSWCLSRIWQRTKTWCQLQKDHTIFIDIYNLLCILSLLGYLRVVLCLSVKRAFEQTHCYEKLNSSMSSFSSKPNSFSLKTFCTWTCFDKKKVQGYSEIANYVKMLRQSVITALCADLTALEILPIQTYSYKGFESVTSPNIMRQFLVSTSNIVIRSHFCSTDHQEDNRPFFKMAAGKLWQN